MDGDRLGCGGRSGSGGDITPTSRLVKGSVWNPSQKLTSAINKQNDAEPRNFLSPKTILLAIFGREAPIF